MGKIKILFMGTPHIADEILKELLNNEDIEVTAVVTQPDRPVGRKKKLTPPPVKVTAMNNNIRVFQPLKVRRNKELKEELVSLAPDFILVVAFGQILPPSVLKIPKYIPVNIHASVLPKYRGASPIQSALLNRDTETGVTFMKMNDKMDEGDIFLIEKVKIDEVDDYFSLEEKLINASRKILRTFFNDYLSGKIKAVPQNHQEASYCKKIGKEDGFLNFNDDVNLLIGKVKAYSLWPKAYFRYEDKVYIVSDALAIKQVHNFQNGYVEINKKYMRIYASNGYLDVLRIKPQSKKEMSVSAFYNGSGKNMNGKILVSD